MFGIILISAGTLIHIYVFWRAASVPVVDRNLPRKLIAGGGVTLWAIFFFARVFGHGGTGPLAEALELAGMNWMGVLFLIFISLLAIDLVTVFGFLMPAASALIARMGLGRRCGAFPGRAVSGLEATSGAKL